MPPIVINVRQTDDVRDLVHRAVQALAEGKLVAFPTETVYGVAASALCEEAVAKLVSAKGRDPNKPLALAIRSAGEIWDYVPNLPPLAQRLARRCWPGPVTLVMDDDDQLGAATQLPESVRKVVAPQGTIGLRVPAHPLILDVLRLIAGPLVLTSANRSGKGDAVTAAEVVESLGDDVHLVLDDGNCQFGQPSSVVRITHAGLQILRSGVVSAATLQRLSSFMILLVCTGNTCRSPMAEGLLRQRVANLLGCSPADLLDRGVVVASAGVSAMPGSPASREAVAVLHESGIDISQHASQPVSERLVRNADIIYTLTSAHRHALLAQWPDAEGRIHMLSPDRRDVSDPIGGAAEDYRRCARQIDALLAQRIEAIDLKSLLTRHRDEPA